MKRGPRVVGGTLAGLSLPFLEFADVRPTAERVRRSMFDIIEKNLLDRCFVDAFAGSGIVGIEALSRGAKHAVFLESNLKVCKRLQANTSRIGLNEKVTIITGDVIETINNCVPEPLYPILFFDPPYHLNVMPKILTGLLLSDYLSKIEFVVIEHHHKSNPLSEIKGWSNLRAIRYGETMLTFADPKDLHEGVLQ